MSAATIEANGAEAPALRLGLRENWPQFALLVAVNAFVGAIVGLERSTLPLVAREEVGTATAVAGLSFIATFGLVKAVANLVTGMLGDRYGRRRLLLIGWVLAIPVPFAILAAPSWWWIVAANALLGASQGLTWSSTVIMKIDLVGPRQRGLAMGLNEFAGYFALGVATLLGGMAAAKFGLRAGPAYAGIAVTVVGFALALLTRETSGHAELEHQLAMTSEAQRPSVSIDARRGRSRRSLFYLNQSGLVNNLNDGLAWGLFPIFFAAAGVSLVESSVLVATYPLVWGVTQLFTGALSDRMGRKPLIVAGMLAQGAALVLIGLSSTRLAWWISLIVLGVGTALVYPTLIAAVSDSVTPAKRAVAVGEYRFWRDSGYVVGAVGAGLLADAFGIVFAIVVVGVVTALSGVLVAGGYVEPHRGGSHDALAS